jgi:hypothetical protein
VLKKLKQYFQPIRAPPAESEINQLLLGNLLHTESMMPMMMSQFLI